ncbi:M50 family metallopeptidase [Paenibacillus sp. NAIST15-1]|uniref:M50 family metallopeptidase n=1 Tax=Paenibacillus sp. NAIST15-1 TaxID=1605994 RepID=UPI001D108824|nr:M50 family metallopeptidase [Paenibacillus sp. NAIST15-1]
MDRLQIQGVVIDIRSWTKVILFIVATACLTRFIPFSSFFRNVDTLIHELSHALMTLVLSGKVMYIHLFSNQSGVTYSAYTSTWKAIPISLAGYIGASLFAVLLFYLHARKQEAAGLIAIASLALISLILFVRNGYGMMWCAGFVILTCLIWKFAPPWLRSGYYLLIAFICLVESVISSAYLVYLSMKMPNGAGDAANLSHVTYIPSIVWALLFTAVSLWCARISMGILFHGTRRGNR